MPKNAVRSTSILIYSPNALPASNSFEAQEFPESEFASLHLVT